MMKPGGNDVFSQFLTFHDRYRVMRTSFDGVLISLLNLIYENFKDETLIGDNSRFNLYISYIMKSKKSTEHLIYESVF